MAQWLRNSKLLPPPFIRPVWNMLLLKAKKESKKKHIRKRPEEKILTLHKVCEKQSSSGQFSENVSELAKCKCWPSSQTTCRSRIRRQWDDARKMSHQVGKSRECVLENKSLLPQRNVTVTRHTSGKQAVCLKRTTVPRLIRCYSDANAQKEHNWISL